MSCRVGEGDNAVSEKGCGVDRKAEHDAGVLEAVEQLCLPGECLVPDP